MAKSTKTKTGKSKVNEAVSDAVEVSSSDEEAVVEVETIASEADVIDTPETPAIEDDLNLDADDGRTDLDIEIVDDPIVEEAPSSAAPTPPPVQTSSSSAFFPLLLGGIVAGAIGYGIATYYPLRNGSDELSSQVSAQADQIAALQAQLAQQPVADLSAIEVQIAETAEQSTARLDAFSASVDANLVALDERILEIEKRPGVDGTLSDTALAAYQRELEELRAELDAQQESVMSAAAQAEADLAAARAEAEMFEQEALASAEAAAVRAALNRVSTAVETGAPFAAALADLGGEDVPAALMDAADTGVSTTAQLTDSFPAAARAALATARAEGVSDDAGGVGGFLRSQFDVRSTAPQEGPSPDAVLSRAEAAIKEGRVADALAEIEALPEVVRAELTDWTAKAQERSDVLDAIATLSETYN